jgi:hypothetical protein
VRTIALGSSGTSFEIFGCELVSMRFNWLLPEKFVRAMETTP